MLATGAASSTSEETDQARWTAIRREIEAETEAERERERARACTLQSSVEENYHIFKLYFSINFLTIFERRIEIKF